MKKNSKTIIIVVTIILVIILSVLIVFLNSMSSNESSQHQEEDNSTTENRDISNNEVQFRETEDGEQELEVLDYNTLIEVTNKISFYTVQDCIEQYLNIKETDTKLYIIKMYEYHTEKSTMQKYLARAMRVDSNNTVNYLNFVVYIDFTEMIYEVENIDNNITDISTVDLSKYNKKLDKDKAKECKYVNLTTEEILNSYLNYWSILINTNINMAYEYLGDDYKKDYFNSIDKFQQYVNNNKQIFENIKIVYCLEPYYESDTEVEYMCIDQNNYSYNIIETAVMQFKITGHGVYDE